MAKKAVAAEYNAPGRRLALFIIESVKFLPVALTLATEARARRLPAFRRRLVLARRLPFPLRRVLQPFLAAAERFALEVRRLGAARFARRRLGAARFARRLGDALRAFRRRVRHAFFAAAERDALVPLRARDFEDLREPLRALRFLVAAAFFADALRLLAFRRRVAAAFFAAAVRDALVRRLLAVFAMLFRLGFLEFGGLTRIRFSEPIIRWE